MKTIKPIIAVIWLAVFSPLLLVGFTAYAVYDSVTCGWDLGRDLSAFLSQKWDDWGM